ncbi:MAG: 2-hydroxyglutaryl-CoA dehydratase [Candidatus Cloacimonetes bacterium HGW-Cloacimonetes-3]|jgi:predicted CoA-substrate-specific enzyme activase|nr:MAG: 2-hydroxyglutaryl-CoA dehydratase [Candidatus Cloacimonetes bacterium HGW-Cloacimonetes-3]
MLKLGIDIGSRNTKIVVYDDVSFSICHYAYQSTDISVLNSVNMLIKEAYSALNIGGDSIACIGVTGYGRKLYPKADSVLSEITCHAAGCKHYYPQARCVIDIGGQDSKIISIDTTGKVADFVMNDKCAAGTGRFLEMTALRLGCEVDALAALAGHSNLRLKLNSTCVVFAESEIIGMMATAISPEDIARAVHHSIVRRIAAQMASLAWEAPIVFTGGVAMNNDLALCMGEELGSTTLRTPEPEITGALGAAILARKA